MRSNNLRYRPNVSWVKTDTAFIGLGSTCNIQVSYLLMDLASANCFLSMTNNSPKPYAIMVSSICLLLLRTKSIVNITFGICSYPPRVNAMTRSAVRPGCVWLILWLAVANSVAESHLIEKPFFQILKVWHHSKCHLQGQKGPILTLLIYLS